jgi:type IV secretion system protein VirB1
MGYTAATLLSLASQCAPGVAAETVVAIIRTESQGDPLALGVNGPRQASRQTSAAGAARVAQAFIAAGYSVDLGLGQINSRNMRWLGLTWDTVFDPCTNIAALGRVLSENYVAVKSGRDPQAALRIALSMYNTGSTSRGFRNGYVAKVVSNAGVTVKQELAAAVPALPALPISDARRAILAENTAQQLAAPRRTPRSATPPPAWNLFERAAFDRQSQEQEAANERGRL